jgi:hypothetical protein
MTDFLFGIFGITGGLFCAFADILLDLKGKNNIKSGPAKIIDSNWQIMSEWRFNASISIAALGVPMYLLGFLGMANQLAQNNKTVSMIFLIFSIIGYPAGCLSTLHYVSCRLLAKH